MGNQVTLSEILGLVVGIIGTVIAVYQTAVINEGKKRKNELQYLLAGINAVANLKQQAWQNQISLLQTPQTPEEREIVKLSIRARDDANEIGGLTSALEGTIDTENSAILTMMDKYKDIVNKSKAMIIKPEIGKKIDSP